MQKVRKVKCERLRWREGEYKKEIDKKKRVVQKVIQSK